jgi:hypothetical protein
MSSKRLDTISDYARHGYSLRVDCRDCGRVGMLDARQITNQCIARGWNRDISQVERRLRCSQCGSRNVVCGPAFGA